MAFHIYEHKLTICIPKILYNTVVLESTKLYHLHWLLNI